MVYLLEINEVDDGWEIVNTSIVKEDHEYLKDDSIYYKTNKELYDHVNVLLSSWNNLIVFDKSKLGFEGAHITRYDISVKEFDSIGVKRTNILKSKLEEVTNSWTVMDTIDLFSFMVCNNKLIEKGIILTGDNTEEAYEKILLLNDESILDLLKIFLQLYSKFEEINENYTKYKDFEKSVVNMTTEELDNI